MKKKIFYCILSFLILCLCGCGATVMEKPNDTNLEFWITEDVTDFDFSDYYSVPGWFGASEYYGAGYTPSAFDENNAPIAPEYCVQYKVTRYPDHSSEKLHITQITITDPAVTFYGICLGSTQDEITNAMTANGYTAAQSYDEITVKRMAFQQDNVSFFFYEEKIVMSATVTNKNGIVF